MSSTSDRHPLLPNNNTAYHALTLHHDTYHYDHSFTTRRASPFSLSWLYCLQLTFSWLLYLVALAAFTASLVLALTHTDTPLPHPLPVTMALIGGAGLVWLLVVPWQQYVEENASPTWEQACCRLAWLTRLVCLLTLLTATILQSVWVLGGDEDEVRWRGGTDGQLLYEFAWWFLVGWWALLCATVVGGCCLCLMCCRAFFLS